MSDKRVESLQLAVDATVRLDNAVKAIRESLERIHKEQKVNYRSDYEEGFADGGEEALKFVLGLFDEEE